MKQQLKNFSHNLRRWYRIIFEHRDLNEIRDDYYAGRWISKSELDKIHRADAIEFLKILEKERADRQELINRFNSTIDNLYLEAENKVLRRSLYVNSP